MVIAVIAPAVTDTVPVALLAPEDTPRIVTASPSTYPVPPLVISKPIIAFEPSAGIAKTWLFGLKLLTSSSFELISIEKSSCVEPVL